MNSCRGCESYQRMTRRQWLRSAVGAAGGATFLGLLDPRILYAAPKKKPDRAQSVILLWMGGGMSHLDTFDPQPGSDFGGPFEGIKTTADGIVISQHLPRIASQFKHLSLIRSMTSNEFDHDRATYLMHTGYQVLPSMKHSTLGSITAKYLGPSPHDANLPPYVSIGIDWAAGYLGPKFAPYYVGAAERANENLVVPQGVGERRFNDRLKLLSEFDRSFRAKYPRHPVLDGFAEHYNAALLMMRPRTAKVFNLDAEPDAVRAAYGETSGFGQGCLLARRLVQYGVRFIEVALPGWDTHQDNFETVKAKSGELDVAVSTLIEDLRAKDLWDQTVVILTSEFGRTPNINGNQGRDHWPRVWSTVIGGGGLVGGQVIGASDRGHEVADRPIRVGELHATICQALDIDWTRSNKSSEGRPFRVVNDHSAAPIAELFA
ncbi:MAG: hypothetical protein B6D36_08045 [Planctomycetes bacterium UTPLA1]|nr:MAG: hypothetical protein B6D36_08045 [Planctomycetes bacterium UTPLA1]